MRKQDPVVEDKLFFGQESTIFCLNLLRLANKVSLKPSLVHRRARTFSAMSAAFSSCLSTNMQYTFRLCSLH